MPYTQLIQTRRERSPLISSDVGFLHIRFERWIALGNTESSRWNQHAGIAAAYLRGQPAVADIGCGTMILRSHLQSARKYLPLDVIPRDSYTFVCDLNNEMPPATGAKAAVMPGVIEYLHGIYLDFLFLRKFRFSLSPLHHSLKLISRRVYGKFPAAEIRGF